MKKKLSLIQTLKHLKKGNTILYPTDTVWGIGGDATKNDVVEKIYYLKKRKLSKPLIILVSSFEMLKNHVGDIPNKLLEYINSDIPTTVIFKNPRRLSPLLTSNENTVGIRIVRNCFCYRLIDAFGKPIISTSANLSGDPTPNNYISISKTVLNGVDFKVSFEKEYKTTVVSRLLKINDASGNVEFIRR